MPDAFTSRRGLFVERGGAGKPLLILLHGMAANASAWRRFTPLVEARWPGRWIAPDFRGHGRSPYEGPYGFGPHAADIADLIVEDGAAEVTLLGHSFGGVIAAFVGSGWFGVKVQRVAAIGAKNVWTEEELARARDVALRPARAFATRAEAIERYLKIAGLDGLLDPDAPDAQIGIVERERKYFAAFDLRASAGVGPAVATILKLCRVPLRITAGERDQMVKLEDMRQIDPAATVIPGAGHNAHWEAPEAVWRFFAAGDPSLD